METAGVDNSKSFAQKRSTDGVVTTKETGIKEGVVFDLALFHFKMGDIYACTYRPSGVIQ